jgi:hypothetical protein
LDNPAQSVSISLTAAVTWTRRDLAAAAALFAFAVFTNIATVLNNSYAFGSTLHDSAIFQTVIWRSGLALKLAPAVSYYSFLNTHFSPINYLPDALSYLMPIDRMSYYGLVYGVVFGLLLLAVFIALRQLFNGRVLPSVAGSLLVYCSGEITVGQFEPHQEYASALFMIACFVAWAMERRNLAITCIVLNATVREDCGALLAMPLLSLALLGWWRERRAGPTRDTVRLFLFAGISIALSAASLAVKHVYFYQLDVMTAVYYDPWPNSFAHLSGRIIMERLRMTLNARYLWLPGLVLCIGALVLRDARIAVGWMAFFPYWLFNFLSKAALSAVLGTYKVFPLILMLVWPAIIGIKAPQRRRAAFCVLQFAVLLSATIGWREGAPRFAVPTGIEQLKERWLLQPETQNAEIYRMMEPRFALDDLGRVRASCGVLALYPYSFANYVLSEVSDGLEDEAPLLDSLVWFDGDRDQPVIDKWRAKARMPWLYRVIGTRILIASRNSPDQMPAFAGTLDIIPQPLPHENDTGVVEPR